MSKNKIIRTICLFTSKPAESDIARLAGLTKTFSGAGFAIQTQRLCSPDMEAVFAADAESDGSIFRSLGSLTFETALTHLPQFLAAKNVAFNVDLAKTDLDHTHVGLLTEIIQKNPGKTFSFAYTFNNVPSSPFFPSAGYAQDGFAVGLQPTDLAEGCTTIEEWLEEMHLAWTEIDGLMAGEADYLGVDTSIAPLYEEHGSFLYFIKRTGITFDEAVTSDRFLKISNYIKTAGPKKTGLCGLMFPTLEDFELADAYDRGNFSIERNTFLSLHSGLGIDCYPIAMDEKPERILDILKLVQGLSNKHQKPLSIRFISDGVTKIGQKAVFNNQYLKDVVIRKL